MCGLRDRSDLAHSRPFPTVRTVRTVHTVRHRPAPSGTVRHNSQWVPSGPQWSPDVPTPPLSVCEPRLSRCEVLVMIKVQYTLLVGGWSESTSGLADLGRGSRL